MRTVRRRGRSRGQTLVEFALVFPFMLLVFFMVIEVGRFIYSWETVSNASREAARLAVVNQNTAAVEIRAAGNAVGLGLRAPNTSDVTAVLTDPACQHGIGCPVTVTVTYRFRMITPIGPLFASICSALGACTPAPTIETDIRAVTTMPVEFECPNTYLTASQCPRQP